MKLYTVSGSFNCRNVEAVINHLGLNVEKKVLSFEKGDLRTEEYTAINPNSKVPTLSDGGLNISESNAIMLYLATEKDPETRLFMPKQRPEILQWMFWETADYNRALQTICFETFVKGIFPQLGKENESLVEAAKQDFIRYAAVLDKHLEGRTYMVGNDWTIADYAVGRVQPVIDKLPVDLTPYPNIRKFYTMFAENPHYTKTRSEILEPT